MAFVVDSKSLIFVLNPRTASTAISTHLGKNFSESRWLPEEDILDEHGILQIQKKHSTINELLENELISEQRLKSLTSFTVVRNPYDSLVSLWTKKKFAYAKEMEKDNFFGKKIPGFLTDMKYIQENTYSDWVVNNFIPKYGSGGKHSIHRKYVSNVDHVLKFERLQDDFDELMSSLNIDIMPIPMVNKTEKKLDNWEQYYTQEALDAVYDCFTFDFEKFGYDRK